MQLDRKALQPLPHRVLGLVCAVLTLGLYLSASPVTAQMPDKQEGWDSVHMGPKGMFFNAVPPEIPLKAEFGAHDPIGLIGNAKIKADCSVHWVDPDNDKVYCFSTGSSLLLFQEWPGKNAEQARKKWLELSSAAQDE